MSEHYPQSSDPTEIVHRILRYSGRMISGSKNHYAQQHPTHLVVFNGNVCTRTRGKIWYGDLDLTLDGNKLQELSDALQEEVFVLREMDGRFENEAAPVLERAVKTFQPGK